MFWKGDKMGIRFDTVLALGLIVLFFVTYYHFGGGLIRQRWTLCKKLELNEVCEAEAKK